MVIKTLFRRVTSKNVNIGTQAHTDVLGRPLSKTFSGQLTFW